MDVVDHLAVLRRRWLAVLLCVLVCLAAAISVTRQTKEIYRSSARMFVNVPAARGVQEALQGVQLSSGLLRSYAEVATSRSAAQQVIDNLDLHMSPGELSRKLSAVPGDDTLIITISATDANPARARQLASATSDVFVDIVNEFERGRSERIEARLIDTATTPTTPIQPKPERNLVLGLLAGLAVGLAAAFALEAVDRSIKTPEQTSAGVGRPLLAVVPRRRRADGLATEGTAVDAGVEAYRALRTSIQFHRSDQAVRSILVTSPGQTEGKTATAANLAVAFAQSGARTIVVDADLRRARLGSLFGAAGEIGLTSVITGKAAVSDALVAWSPNLSVLPAGPLPPNPAELMGSKAMARLLAELDGLADIVLIDAPPVIPVTDAVALSTQVHAVVTVVRAGRTQRDAAAEATRRLEVVGADVIGAVLNAAPRSGARFHQASRYEMPTANVTRLLPGRSRRIDERAAEVGGSQS